MFRKANKEYRERMSNTKSAESTLSESIFNRQALVRLILPLLAEQFLSVAMGMADTLMVSGVGEAAVSSVSWWTA